MRTLTFLSLLLVTLACHRGPDIGSMATDMCDCMQPVAEAFNTIRSAPDDITPEEMSTLMDDMEAEMEAFEACSERLEEKYGEALHQEEEAIRQAMDERCPEVTATMREAEAAME